MDSNKYDLSESTGSNGNRSDIAIDHNNMTKSTVIVIAGPTASGKSTTAIRVAQALKGEIISADSMQVYRGMDIGTAKVTPEEQQLVPHHLIDLMEPDEGFSVAAWQTAALTAIDGIVSRGRVPIVCGGTGQYISALMDGLVFAPVPTDPALREALNARADRVGNKALIAEIAAFDAKTAARLHENDRKRIIRALEVHQLMGISPSELNQQSRIKDLSYHYVGFCLWPERATLYARINQRVDLMLNGGLIEEVRALSLQNLPEKATCRQAIGYKEVFEYLEGEATLEAVTERIKQSTRQYAKRQMTWFRRMTQLIPVTEAEPEAAAIYILKSIQ